MKTLEIKPKAFFLNRPHSRLMVLLFAALLATLPLWGQTKIRIMAANLSSGPHQTYDPGHGNRILQGLAPDVVLIQEFNVGSNSEEEINAWVGTHFGPEFHYYRESGDSLPNGVISRYPLLERGEWPDINMSNRDFAWARIDLPGNRELWAISVHLKAGGARDRRALEAENLMAFIKQHVPESDYLVLGGDFNTRTRSETCIEKMKVFFKVQGPWPADAEGNDNTNQNRNKPYDWVLADADLDPLETPVVIGEKNYPNGLVFDSRVFQDLSLVAPVAVDDSEADQMQHMAVIRDFLFHFPDPTQQQQQEQGPLLLDPEQKKQLE